jgi:hypothetical protein
MSVMRGIAFRRPVGLAGLPDDMMIGEPSGFDIRAVEKIAEPLTAFAYDSAHVSFLQLAHRARAVCLQHDARAGTVSELTVAS